MDQTTLIVNRALPIVLLLALGYWMRRSQFLAASTIDDLRKVAVNVALPAVLFLAFLQIELQPEFLVIFVTLFLLNVLLFALGFFLKRRLNIPYVYFPFLMTGFEVGMLGISLFGGAYGLENTGFIAIFDVGHELFIWFVFLAFLLMERDDLRKPAELAAAFFRSPVIIAIIAGLLLNLLGAADFITTGLITGGVTNTLDFLSGLIVPVILIIVGYGIQVDRSGMREAALVIGVRLAIVVPLALILNAVLIRGLLGLEFGFEAALFTLLVLPPPFIIPLFMRTDLDDERRYINNVLMLYTLVSMVLFAVYFVLNPTL